MSDCGRGLILFSLAGKMFDHVRSNWKIRFDRIYEIGSKFADLTKWKWYFYDFG